MSAVPKTRLRARAVFAPRGLPPTDAHTHARARAQGVHGAGPTGRPTLSRMTTAPTDGDSALTTILRSRACLACF